MFNKIQNSEFRIMIKNYFELEEKQKENVIIQLETAQHFWRAISFLLKLLKENSFYEHLGKGQLLLLFDETKFLDAFPVLKGFVSLCDKDEVIAPELFPWIGFVFVFPEYRGNRLSGVLIDYATNVAKELYSTSNYVYISTDHIGLYEKFGFSYVKEEITVWGEQTRFYKREIIR